MWKNLYTIFVITEKKCNKADIMLEPDFSQAFCSRKQLWKES
jgi:hypothetical protein